VCSTLRSDANKGLHRDTFVGEIRATIKLIIDMFHLKDTVHDQVQKPIYPALRSDTLIKVVITKSENRNFDKVRTILCSSSHHAAAEAFGNGARR
jgi:RNA-binding protein YhbY